MATRAQQFECLAAGIIKDGATIATPYAVFYAAGTTTPKDAYADINKDVAITKKALDAQGRAICYGDGIYKISIYSGDPDAGGIFTGIEMDNYKVTATTGNAKTITGDTTGVRDDGFIIANTVSSNINYTLPTAADYPVDRPLTIKKKAAANVLTYTAFGSENIDGNPSGTLVDQNATVQLFTDGVNWYGAEIVGTAATLGGFAPSETAVAGTIPVYNSTPALVGNITGNAATVTNGVYTTGNQTVAGIKTFSSTIVGTIDKAIAAVFGTRFVAGKNSQTSYLDAGLTVISESGHTHLGLAAATTACSIRHNDGGSGIVIVGIDGNTLAPVTASTFVGSLTGNADTVTTTTTAQTIAATAGAGIGAAGTYSMLYDTIARQTTPGTTRAGSELRYANTHDAGHGGSAAAGTWRCMGHSGVVGGVEDLSTITRTTLWLRSA